jgi:hypothetical protein
MITKCNNNSTVLSNSWVMNWSKTGIGFGTGARFLVLSRNGTFGIQMHPVLEMQPMPWERQLSTIPRFKPDESPARRLNHF